MLRDLAIRNYRVFKDFAIDGLARVNLIVGANNAGKTSFLEAVYLLVNQGDPFCLLELLHNRGEYIERSNGPPRSGSPFAYQVAHLFRGHSSPPLLSPVVTTFGPETRAQFSVREQQEQGQSLQLHLRTNPQMSRVTAQMTADNRWLPYELQLIYYVNSQEASSRSIDVDDDYSAPGLFLPSRKRSGPHRFITAGNPDFAYLSELWDSITFAPGKEREVVKALQILEPGLEDVRFTSHQTAGGVLVKLGGQQNRIPLSSMGAGMHRMLMLAMAAVTAEGGVLLVDEIDTGLYHGVQADMWRLLIETARRLDVQIFATTHSWDCVAAFQEALAQQPDSEVGQLFRLELWKGDVRAVKYDADDLAIAVRHAIEVR